MFSQTLAFFFFSTASLKPFLSLFHILLYSPLVLCSSFHLYVLLILRSQIAEEFPVRRKWQPTPVFLPGNSHGQRSLVGYSPGGHKGVGHSLVTKRLVVVYEFQRVNGKVWENGKGEAGRCGAENIFHDLHLQLLPWPHHLKIMSTQTYWVPNQSIAFSTLNVYLHHFSKWQLSSQCSDETWKPSLSLLLIHLMATCPQAVTSPSCIRDLKSKIQFSPWPQPQLPCASPGLHHFLPSVGKKLFIHMPTEH